VLEHGLGADKARREGERRDAVRAQLLGHAERQPDDGELGQVVDEVASTSVWSSATGMPRPPAASTSSAVSSIVSGRRSSANGVDGSWLGRGFWRVLRPVQ
jgi:hypothetical protein